MNARIVLVVDESSPVARLVGGLATLEQQSLPHHALIVGLAVSCRLATAHRPTADVDTLARDDAIPSAVEVLVTRRATRTSTGVELAGVKIDILEVGDPPPPEAFPDDELARAFVLAHSWALATAEPTRIDARSPEGRIVTSAQLDVATPAALVAMKLHAINQRRASTQVKRGSDAYDIYRLLEAHDAAGSVGPALLHAPGDLADWCSEQIERLFVTDPERTYLLIGNALAPGTFALVPDDLRAVGEAFFG